MPDETTRLIRLAKPDLQPWAESDAAGALYERVLDIAGSEVMPIDSPHRRSRRVIAVSAFVLGAGLATATATYATRAFEASPAPLTDPTVACYSARMTHPPTIFVLNVEHPTAATAEAACRSQWRAAMLSQPPDGFIACVIPPYRIAKVFPAGVGSDAAEVCQSMSGTPLR